MLPWAEMMRGAAMIGLSPHTFWALSIREWHWLTSDRQIGLPRPDFDRLQNTYPDRKEGDHGRV
ncbi:MULTISPECIES: phage tail assembly chaperone [Henriciella]|jgi:hypothetical protein|uniref:Phage tail assembly chaperone n=1 Tax=Henriciella pelagia TaxID=1977912 RepID=A0ABQ1J244_9PROT|nr:phage tail assembly chaperone [Henriciella pelagia]GGB56792.1 hypothetical protein GCM10011503_01420 [Henriciella pelagia]